VLFERWTSQEALDTHLGTMRAAPKPPPGVVPKTASIIIYDVSGERQLR
jgi:quinol monooxygenase YgiN